MKIISKEDILNEYPSIKNFIIKPIATDTLFDIAYRTEGIKMSATVISSNHGIMNYTTMDRSIQIKYLINHISEILNLARNYFKSAQNYDLNFYFYPILKDYQTKFSNEDYCDIVYDNLINKKKFIFYYKNNNSNKSKVFEIAQNLNNIYYAYNDKKYYGFNIEVPLAFIILYVVLKDLGIDETITEKYFIGN